MNCVLTKEQHLQFYKKIASDLFDIAKSKEPLDIKLYIKDIYDTILDKTKDPDLALAYILIIPRHMITIEGLNWEETNELFTTEHNIEIRHLAKSFAADSQNALDYIIPKKIDQEEIDNALQGLPTSGSNILPIITGDDLINIVERNSAIASSIQRSTGSDTKIVAGKYTGIIKPIRQLAIDIRANLITQLRHDGLSSSSELVYSFKKGFKLKLINETQLPDNIADLEHPRDERNMVLLITDNNGIPYFFDKDGNINDKGQAIYYSFLMPGERTITDINIFIKETLATRRENLEKTKLTKEQIDIEIANDKEQLENKRDFEKANMDSILSYYRMDPKRNTLLDFTGGSTGYVNEPGTGKGGYPNTSKFKFENQEDALQKISYPKSGKTTIRIDGVDKHIIIEALPLDNFSNDIEQVVNVLMTSAKNLTNQDKINYLRVYLQMKKSAKDSAHVSIYDLRGELMLEVRGKTITLSKSTSEDVLNLLLNSRLFFNISADHIKNTDYTHITVDLNGIVTKETKKFTDLVYKYTKLNAVPNDEGKIVALNGYFYLHHSPVITKVEEDNWY